ncbi:MAG: GDP-mannose 4,6-dehydratase [Candidatus Tectomicrobia bacterium]|nr:GDP-mannose 4,6-dehydratase [Candidatus Tectomicrobia bacterium]
MRILVTGGAGFIGSHLTEALLCRGDRVTVLDNLSTGDLRNIKHLLDDPNLEFIEGSVTDAELTERLVSPSDQVYHLAAAVGVRLIMERPVETIETNVWGTEMVLRATHAHMKKVLIASTSEVYGKNSSGPLKENDDRVMGSVMKQRWAYANTKTLDEFLALAYHRERNLPVVVVRLFNTVGPRQTGAYGMVIPNFVQSALAGEPIRVFGDGRQSRCFCHVSDVVRGLMGLMEHPGALGEVFNIGNPVEISIGDLAHRVKEMTGSPSEIIFIPYEDAYGQGFEDMRRRVPDLTKVRNLIGFEPQVPLDQILQSIIDYFRGLPEKERGGTAGPSRSPGRMRTSGAKGR